jgi:hypothetical protein
MSQIEQDGAEIHWIEAPVHSTSIGLLGRPAIELVGSAASRTNAR